MQGTSEAHGDKNEYVIFSTPDPAGRTMCTAEATRIDYMKVLETRDLQGQVTGYACKFCGGWVTIGFEHQCIKIFPQAQNSPAPDWFQWLVLAELKRIASALEKLAGQSQATLGPDEQIYES